MKSINNNSSTKRGTIMKKCRNIGAMALCLGVFISLCSCLSSGERVDTIKSPDPVTTAAKETSSTEKITTEAKTTEAPTEPETEPETEGTYENNKYYDIVEKGAYNKYGTTYLIYKVLAKEDVSVDATIIAYADDGSVIGKSSDNVTLTKDEGNYFKFMFDNDISNAQLQVQVNFNKDSFMTGERSAVEMVQYNQSGDDLYITFKQTGDELGAFAQFKLLFYKGDDIVDSDDGYFSVYAQNLNGKDTTDVAEIWAYGTDYDRIEYFYEP